jgi:hypothetical protein
MFISVLHVDLWIGGKWQNEMEIGMPETRMSTEHKKQKGTTREGDKEGERGRYRMGK